MSKVDDVFGPIPGPLMQEWGQDVVFVQQTSSTYDANTGTVTKNTTSYNVKAVITKLKIQELNGLPGKRRQDPVGSGPDRRQLRHHGRLLRSPLRRWNANYEGNRSHDLQRR